MTKRSYDQYCGIAYALDILGERWTLLIIRELLLGPCRFKDLHEGLSGIGTNLLSDRLSKLQDYHIIRQRELPPPAASTVYELTQRGMELSPILESLASWGSRFLPPPNEKDEFNPRWLLLALKSKFDPEKAEDVDTIIQFDIDGEAIHARITKGTLNTYTGSHEDADLRIVADKETFLNLAMSGFDANAAYHTEGMTLEGDASLIHKLGDWFALPSIPPAHEAGPARPTDA